MDLIIEGVHAWVIEPIRHAKEGGGCRLIRISTEAGCRQIELRSDYMEPLVPVLSDGSESQPKGPDPVADAEREKQDATASHASHAISSPCLPMLLRCHKCEGDWQAFRSQQAAYWPYSVIYCPYCGAVNISRCARQRAWQQGRKKGRRRIDNKRSSN